jgi:hypothetical protein
MISSKFYALHTSIKNFLYTLKWHTARLPITSHRYCLKAVNIWNPMIKWIIKAIKFQRE